MSHDLWASLSAVELAANCQTVPQNWFSATPPWSYQTYALQDPGASWPIADGSLEVQQLPSGKSRFIAVEFKRVNEGIHGILTGMGQVQAYLKKGFTGAALVLPKRYETLDDPGPYAQGVFAGVTPTAPIAVFTYDDPDFASASPFAGKLTCVRPMKLDPSAVPTPPKSFTTAGRSSTQWAHVREGSTVPDYFYRYLKAVLDVMSNPTPYEPELRSALARAANRRGGGKSPRLYLSNTAVGGRKPFADEAWRRYWFRNVLTLEVQRVWASGSFGTMPDTAPTRLRQWDGNPSVFFAKRGPAMRSKPQLVEAVAAGGLTALQAWDRFAESVSERAHSHREDVDSGLEAIGLIGADGHLTEAGFRFVKACDRAGDANAPGPVAILRWALLVEGGFATFLHYVHSLSEELFQNESAMFTSESIATHKWEFQSVPYRYWLAERLVKDLRVANSSSLRSATRGRPPLEGELILLRKLGLVRDWRTGVGIEINWPAVHTALELGGIER